MAILTFYVKLTGFKVIWNGVKVKRWGGVFWEESSLNDFKEKKRWFAVVLFSCEDFWSELKFSELSLKNLNITGPKYSAN